MVIVDRFKSQSSSSSSFFSSSTVLTNKIIQYVENSFLLILTAAICASPYVSSNLYNSYLYVFTMIFIVVQSFNKARQVIMETTDIKSKSSMIKLVSFLGAFVIAMLGFKQLNLNETAGTSKLWTALSLSVFPYGISDILSGNSNVSDLFTNGISAMLMIGGCIGLYFEKNFMGICCFLSLVVKAMKGFCNKNFGSKNARIDYWYPLLFGVTSLVVVLYCYWQKIELSLPNLVDFFKKGNEALA